MQRFSTCRGGFALTEVLIAACLVTVGMLAVARLQLTALRATRDALLLAEAVTLASNLAERLRANPSAADAYDCNGSCTTNAGGDAIAIADLAEWSAEIAARLPDGDGAVIYIAGSAVSPALYAVTVTWADSAATGGREATTLTIAR